MEPGSVIREDWIEDFNCSDQRLVFKIVLAELRRIRAVMKRAETILSEPKEDFRQRALDALRGKEVA